MNHDHDHPHPHDPEPGHGPVEPGHAPAPGEDAGSLALEAALRSSFVVVKVAMVAMVVVFFCSGFFTVGPQQKAVILRFGKPVGEGQQALLGAGLHWHFPYPIDDKVIIPITEVQKVSSTVGWYYQTPEQQASGEDAPGGASLDPGRDGYVITADQNIIHVKATLYYHIDDPLRYVFDFTSASNTVQNALNNALLDSAARFNVDNLLLLDQTGFKDAVRQRVTDLTDRQRMGITIDNCEVDHTPPQRLKADFDRVTTARENRNKLVEDATSYATRVLNAAGAQAVTITNLAVGERDNYVNSLKAEAKRFSDLLPQYQKYPSLFAQQKLLEAMSGILTNVQDKWYLSEREDGKTRELRLMLNREPPEPKPGGNP
jgi:membrane protease subunit HflK